MEVAFIMLTVQVCLAACFLPQMYRKLLAFISDELKEQKSAFHKNTYRKLLASVIQNKIPFHQHSGELYQLFLLTCVSLIAWVLISELNGFNSELDLKPQLRTCFTE